MDEATRDRLKKASDHLHYEIWMLDGTAWELTKLGSNDGSVEHNALIESFGIHARLLLDVFYAPANKRSDDVCAEDFFDNQTDWKTKCPSKSALLEKVDKRVGKELAHLTYARLGISLEDKQWPFVKIANEIENMVKVFVENVPEDRLGDLMLGLKKGILSEVSSS
jgi:hypothetical protein